MKKILTILLITSISIATAKSTETQIGFDNKLKENKTLLAKKPIEINPIFETLGIGHRLPPPVYTCNVNTVPSGCTCGLAGLVCHEQ